MKQLAQADRNRAFDLTQRLDRLGWSLGTGLWDAMPKPGAGLPWMGQQLDDFWWFNGIEAWKMVVLMGLKHEKWWFNRIQPTKMMISWLFFFFFYMGFVYIMWAKQCHFYHPWLGMVYTNYKNGDFSGCCSWLFYPHYLWKKTMGEGTSTPAMT